MKADQIVSGKDLLHPFSALKMFLLIVFAVLGSTAIGQNNREAGVKITPLMSMSYKSSDGMKHVKIAVTRKVNKKRVAVNDAWATVDLYVNAIKASDPSDGTGLIGKLHLNYDGEVVFDFPKDFNSKISGFHTWTFIAEMDSDKIYSGAQETLTVSDAKINIDYSVHDTVKTATATLYIWKDSNYVALPGTEMKLFVKRSFSLLPVEGAGVSTDKNGTISGDLPLDIPGEAGGKLTIVANITDNENYGTVEVSRKVDWSILPHKNEAMGRTLWASGKNAPIPLVVASCSIIVLIWGIIIYLVSRLFYIKKIGKIQL
jgi:hypothetical protein